MTTQTTAVEAVELPPLPEPVPEPLIAFSGCYYTADQMHAYALESNQQLRDQNTALDAACAKLEAEVAVLRAALAGAIAYLVPRLSHQPNSQGATVVLPKLRAALTQGAQS